MGKSSSNTIAAALKKTAKGQERAASAAPSLAATGRGGERLALLDAHRSNLQPAKSVTSEVKRGEISSKSAASRRSKAIGEQIGKELRELYDDVVTQPIPERFLELLNELESSTISPLAKVKAPGEGE